MTQHTPDGRYIIVRGRLWRAANPHLPEEERAALVKRLMDLRREKKGALRDGDRDQITQLRQQIDQVKRALGERGPVWWDDEAPDENRKMAVNSTYAAWWATVSRTASRTD